MDLMTAQSIADAGSILSRTGFCAFGAKRLTAQIGSAVDINYGASGKLGPWRGQEQYGMGDFLGSSDSPEWALMADGVTIGPL